MVETSGDNLNEAFRFVARDATNGKVTQLNGAVSSSNTIVLDAFADGDFTVGDRVTFKDTSGNIHFRFITSVTHGSEQLTISGSAVSIADDSYFVSGILTDELDYLPNFKPTTAGQDGSKAYRKQLVIPSNCDTLEFGFHYLGSETDQFLYYDDIALSANQFLQVSSQGQTEEYMSNGWGGRVQYRLYGGTERINTLNKLGSVSVGDSSNGWRYTSTAKQKVNMTVTAGLSGGNSYLAILKGTIAQVGTNTTSGTDSSYENYRMAIAEIKNGDIDEISASFIVEKDEIIEIATSNNAQNPHTGATNANVHLTATPLVNDVVLLNSGVNDELFTDWIEYTPTITAADAGSGSYFRWRRVGSNMQISAIYEHGGTRTSSTWTMTLPSGYAIDTFGTSSQYHIAGRYHIDYSIGNGYRGGQMLYRPGETVLYRGNDQLYNTDADFNHMAPVQGNSGGVGAATWNINVSIPIAGWSSTFNPVLSMPLVDFSNWENTFSGKIDGSSSGATIVANSQSPYNWIESVTRNSQGNFTITYPGLGLSHPPNIQAITDRVHTHISVGGVTATQCTFVSYDPYFNVYRDDDFVFQLTKVASDYVSPPQPTAAVIKPAVAIGKVEASQGTNGGSSSGDSFHQRKFASWSGETWFMSGFDGTMGVDGTTDQFDLDPGTYKVAGNTISYQADQCFSVMDSTDNSVVINGTHNYASDGEAVTSDNPFAGTFTITEKKTFKIWTYIFSAETNTGLGVAANESGWNEVFGQVTIEKLK